MISNLFDRNLVRILLFFLISPGSRYNRKEIKERVGMNNVPLDNNLRKLVLLKVLKQEKSLLYINSDSDEVREILVFLREEYRNFDLPYKVFNIIVDIAGNLSKVRAIKKVYLFGSYAKLIYSDKSDIDIAVVFDNKIRDRKIVMGKVKKVVCSISKKIEVHFFLEKDMEEKDILIKDILIKDILRNGKRLF